MESRLWLPRGRGRRAARAPSGGKFSGPRAFPWGEPCGRCNWPSAHPVIAYPLRIRRHPESVCEAPWARDRDSRHGLRWRAGAERRLPAGAATAHLPRRAGAMRVQGLGHRVRHLPRARCRRCAVERAQSARALSPGPALAVPRVPIRRANLHPRLTVYCRPCRRRAEEGRGEKWGPAASVGIWPRACSAWCDAKHVR